VGAGRCAMSRRFLHGAWALARRRWAEGCTLLLGPICTWVRASLPASTGESGHSTARGEAPSRRAKMLWVSLLVNALLITLLVVYFVRLSRAPAPAPARAADRSDVPEVNPSDVPELVKTVASPASSPARRAQAEQFLKQLDGTDVLEAIHPEIERLEEEPDARPRLGGGFFLEEELPDVAKALNAVRRVWDHFVYWDSEKHGTVLLSLLKRARTAESKGSILTALRRHYVPAAEEP